MSNTDLLLIAIALLALILISIYNYRKAQRKHREGK